MKTRLLIADSDEALLPVYERYFAAHDCDVETAAGGVDCLDKLSRFRPDVMIVDRHLPWGGGDGVLAAMQTDRSIARTPVVLLDGADCAPTVIGSAKVAHHHKPVSLATLLASVRQAARPLASQPASSMA